MAFYYIIKNRRGQSILETGVLLLVIAAAMVLMQVYLRRAVQGRMRESVESIGGEYDPVTTTSDSTMSHASNQTTLTTTDTVSRRWVQRYGYGYTRPVIADVTVTTINMQTHYDNTTRAGYETIPEP